MSKIYEKGKWARKLKCPMLLFELFYDNEKISARVVYKTKTTQ